MREEKVLISIIVPVYNCRDYLPKCAGSLLDSGIDSLQLILVDDASSDGSGELCDALAASDGRVSVVHTENRGPSAARNIGIELASGKYLGFADSDDYVDSAAFAKTVGKLKNIRADVLAVDFFRVADNGTVLDRVFQIKDTAEPICDNSYKLAFLSAKDCVWNIWRYIYRRDYIIRSALRFAVGVNCGEDLQFAVNALMGTESTAYYHNPYYYYRVNYGATLTRRFSAERVAQLMSSLSGVYCKATEADTRESKQLAAKLSREYILNLSICAEAPENERAEICRILGDNRHLMQSASGIYASAARCADIFGIPFSSRALYMIKKAKRLFRYLKQRRNSSGS